MSMYYANERKKYFIVFYESYFSGYNVLPFVYDYIASG